MDPHPDPSLHQISILKYFKNIYFRSLFILFITQTVFTRPTYVLQTQTLQKIKNKLTLNVKNNMFLVLFCPSWKVPREPVL